MMSEQFIPITISNRALKEIKNIMVHKNIPSDYGLRIGISGGGCGGMSYILGFDKKKENDTAYEINGIPVYVEKKHTMYLLGMEVDFYEGSDARGFTFVQPDQDKNKVIQN